MRRLSTLALACAVMAGCGGSDDQDDASADTGCEARTFGDQTGDILNLHETSCDEAAEVLAAHFDDADLPGTWRCGVPPIEPKYTQCSEGGEMGDVAGQSELARRFDFCSEAAQSSEQSPCGLPQASAGPESTTAAADDPKEVAAAFAEAVATGSPELCDFTPDLSDAKCNRLSQRLADSPDVQDCYGSMDVTDVDEADGIVTVSFSCKSVSATGGAIDVEELAGKYIVVESNVGADA